MTAPGISADRNWSGDARPASVLIVEDDAGIATQLARGLQLAGYETSSVGAGRDVPGWPAADVVLLDLGLPDVDGVEVCRKLRARSEVAIIVVTARGEESDRVVSRPDILDQAWDAHWYGPMKALDVHIAALRKKLGEPKMIETVYGRGFRLADPR